MSRRRIESGPPCWEARILEKSHSNSLFIAIRNIYVWVHDMAPPQCICYKNIHEHTWSALGCGPNNTCKADGVQVHMFWITSWSPLWRDLTKVISILTGGPRNACPGRGIEPGPPWWEASTLEKSHSNNLVIGSYSEHLHMSPRQSQLRSIDFYHSMNKQNIFESLWQIGLI